MTSIGQSRAQPRQDRLGSALSPSPLLDIIDPNAERLHEPKQNRGVQFDQALEPFDRYAAECDVRARDRRQGVPAMAVFVAESEKRTGRHRRDIMIDPRGITS